MAPLQLQAIAAARAIAERMSQQAHASQPAAAPSAGAGSYNNAPPPAMLNVSSAPSAPSAPAAVGQSTAAQQAIAAAQAIAARLGGAAPAQQQPSAGAYGNAALSNRGAYGAVAPPSNGYAPQPGGGRGGGRGGPPVQGASANVWRSILDQNDRRGGDGDDRQRGSRDDDRRRHDRHRSPERGGSSRRDKWDRASR